MDFWLCCRFIAIAGKLGFSPVSGTLYSNYWHRYFLPIPAMPEPHQWFCGSEVAARQRRFRCVEQSTYVRLRERLSSLCRNRMLRTCLSLRWALSRRISRRRRKLGVIITASFVL
jgi:hypothetical protein